jgi:hypothetical protein
MNPLTFLVTKARAVLRDRWCVCHAGGPSTEGAVARDAFIDVAATFHTKAGARWWAWRHHWGRGRFEMTGIVAYPLEDD